MELEFSGELWTWRGPAPWHFVTLPADESALIQDLSPLITYGWGMIPATIRIGATEWDTALWVKDDRYIVPIKAAVRRAEQLDEGDHPTVQVVVRVDP
jgi:hypothetical protein